MPQPSPKATPSGHSNDLLTISEAARVVGVSKQAIEDAIRRDALPHVVVKIPAKRIFRRDVVAYAKRTKGRPGRPR